MYCYCYEKFSLRFWHSLPQVVEKIWWPNTKQLRWLTKLPRTKSYHHLIQQIAISVCRPCYLNKWAIATAITAAHRPRNVHWSWHQDYVLRLNYFVFIYYVHLHICFEDVFRKKNDGDMHRLSCWRDWSELPFDIWACLLTF